MSTCESSTCRVCTCQTAELSHTQTSFVVCRHDIIIKSISQQSYFTNTGLIFGRVLIHTSSGALQVGVTARAGAFSCRYHVHLPLCRPSRSHLTPFMVSGSSRVGHGCVHFACVRPERPSPLPTHASAFLCSSLLSHRVYSLTAALTPVFASYRAMRRPPRALVAV
jgi:hypothetical protein